MMKRVICLVVIVLNAGGCADTSTSKLYPKAATWQGFQITEDIPEFQMPQMEREELTPQEKESLQRFGHKYGLAEPQKVQPRNLTEFEKLHKVIIQGITDGVFYSVTPEINEARIDPFLWNTFTVEHKRTMVKLFEEYFKLHPNAIGSPGRPGVATIRSKFNDEILGRTGWFGGYKINK